MMWNKQDYNLYFKTDEMDRINIIYDYFFYNNTEQNNDESYQNIRYDSDILFLYKDISTILVFGNKQSKKEKIELYKDYMIGFILNGFVIETSKITNKDLNYFQRLEDEKLKQNFNLIKKYTIIHGNSINIIGYN